MSDILNPHHFGAIAIGATEAYPDGKASVDEDGNITTVAALSVGGDVSVDGALDPGNIVAASVAALAVNGDDTDEATIFSGALPSGKYRVGSEINLAGIIDATAFNGSDTLTISIKIGEDVIATVDLDSSDIGAVQMAMILIVQVLGASGKVLLSQCGIAGAGNIGAADPEILDIDLTAAPVISITAQWSAADPGNTASLLGATLRIL